MPAKANEKLLTLQGDYLTALYNDGIFDDLTFSDFLKRAGVKAERVTVTTWRAGTYTMPAGAFLLLPAYLGSNAAAGLNRLTERAGLRCISDESVAPTGREVVDEAMDLPSAVAKIHEHVREARRDGVIDAEEAKRIDGACEAAMQEIAEVRACVRPSLRSVSA